MAKVEDLRKARVERAILAHISGEAVVGSVLGIASDGARWVVVRASLGSPGYAVGRGTSFYEAWDAAMDSGSESASTGYGG